MKYNSWPEMSYNQRGPMNTHERLSYEHCTTPITESQEDLYNCYNYLTTNMRNLNKAEWDLYYDMLERLSIDNDSIDIDLFEIL